MTWTQVSSLRLRNAPRAFKALALGFVFSISLAYLYALGNIVMVVGLTPKDIAVHYYGATTNITESPVASGEETINLEDLGEPSEAAPIAPGPRPSFKNLVGEGHFHLFGMSSFFFGLCLLALFTGINETLKSFLVGGAFVFVVLDNISFMATRFLGPKFAMMTAVSGGIMGLCFAGLWLSIVYELLQKKELK
ncbi:MAG: hypothetical protein RJB66_2682 [Pseudomonadota bacterium]|jgi:hypothetical protein